MWQNIKNLYHLLVALLVNIWFGFPSKDLMVVGVTGTDGKTTTSSLIYYILDKTGEKVAMITTLGVKMGKKEYESGFHITTPSSIFLQKYIKKIKKEGFKYLVLEVTSHALDQNRVFGIPFEIGVVTNVTHEHLDYHKTYKKYLEAKLKLLSKAKVCIVNKDDESYGSVSSKFIPIKSGQSSKLITYGLGTDAHYNPKTFPFESNLMGEFNKYNILAAIAVCKNLGIKDQDIRRALKTFEVPVGRQEMVYNKDFKVIIDFAHTPHAFDQILAVFAHNKNGRLIHVFGAAGNRDRSKRPFMGKIAATYDNIIILTAEDPRSEKVEKICEEIEKGINQLGDKKHKVKIFKITDRQEAINYALSLAKKGDVVLVTGKGHEQSMNLGQGEIPWSEHESVRKALKLRLLS